MTVGLIAGRNLGGEEPQACLVLSFPAKNRVALQEHSLELYVRKHLRSASLLYFYLP